MMERVALSAGRCGSECVEYSTLAISHKKYKSQRYTLFKTNIKNIKKQNKFYKICFKYRIF